MTRAGVLALALAGAAACGLKTAPVAPELVRPLPTTSLRAAPAPGGMRLVWRRPSRYAGGGRMRDIERFDIERSVDDQAEWSAAGGLVMSDRYRLRQPSHIEWTDTTAVPGTRYRYRVITVTRDGQRSAPSKPVAARHRVVTPEDTPDES